MAHKSRSSSKRKSSKRRGVSAAKYGRAVSAGRSVLALKSLSPLPRDHLLRQATVQRWQQAHGNAFVQRQLAQDRSNQADAAQGIATNGKDAGGGDKPPLSSSLMQGNAYLNEVANGRALLAKGTKAVTPVKLVQMALITAVPQISLGKTGVSGIDGDFGQLTEDAVKQFQADRGLNQDGLVGPMTLKALDSTVASKSVQPAGDVKGSPLPENVLGRRDRFPGKAAMIPEAAPIGDVGGFGVEFYRVDEAEESCGELPMLTKEVETRGGYSRGTASPTLQIKYTPRPVTKDGKIHWAIDLKCITVAVNITLSPDLKPFNEIACDLSKNKTFLEDRSSYKKDQSVKSFDLMSDTVPWTSLEATSFHETLHAVSFHVTASVLSGAYRQRVKEILRPEEEEGGNGQKNTELELHQVTKEKLHFPWYKREMTDDRLSHHPHWDIREAQFMYLVNMYDNWKASGGEKGCGSK